MSAKADPDPVVGIFCLCGKYQPSRMKVAEAALRMGPCEDLVELDNQFLKTRLLKKTRLNQAVY